ncbi:ATP-binding protein [Shewanella psychrotolerans]|uniref:ATP-binding protein n=1 Tax=Shewanella psychrotolerans TaxID=2864206 RepID=UPI001C65F807|nr:ATP-binding protein [Shewanella psychrotolerans]QYK00709.1 response regulator [Shewanella psychrotolerans]
MVVNKRSLTRLFDRLGRSLLTISFVTLFFVSVVAVVVFESRLTRSIVSEEHSNLSDVSRQIDHQIQEHLSRYSDNLRFLYSTPPVSGLTRAKNNHGVDPVDNSSYLLWRKRLEVIFESFLRNKSEYEQLRIVSLDGNELVRVDQRANLVQVVDDSNLQNKTHRDYFAASVKLPPNEVYTSAISLNREFGRIESPHRPMLRLSIAIFDESGKRFGFMIANINVAQLLNSFEKMIPSPYQFILLDQDGFFLVHPDKEAQFSRDLAPEQRWDKRYLIVDEVEDDFHKVIDRYKDNKPYYIFRDDVTLSSYSQNGQLEMMLLTSKTDIDQIMASRRFSVYSFMLALSLLFAFVVIILHRNAKSSYALTAARAQSSAIIGSSKDAIISVSTKGQITSWNRSAQLLFGYDAKYAIGRMLSDLSLLEEVDLAELVDELHSDDKSFCIETSFMQENGTQLYLSVSLSSITNEYQECCGVAVIISDITIEKNAAQKIQSINAELEKKVAIRTAELERASRVKSTFISNISHEMRTPLNGIVGTLNLLKGEPLSASQSRYLNMAEVSVNALAILINDVLDLSKIEAGKLELNIQPFNPRHLVESLCGGMAVKAQEEGLDFIIDLVDLNCISIVSDMHRVSQILSNLINNAIKFTEKGMVKVSVTSLLTNTGEMQFSCHVSDSGIGIAAENQNKLFQAFTQENMSISSKYGGTGLGLSICKQLSELLNGSISFKSEKGVGSTFTFTMNLEEGDYTLTSFPPVLAGHQCVLRVAQPTQSVCIERALTALGGEVVSAQSLLDWLIDNQRGSESMPDVIVIEQQDPLLVELDNKWNELVSSFNPPKILIFQRSGEPPVRVTHAEVTLINNPLLISELIKVFGEEEEQLGSSYEHHSEFDASRTQLTLDKLNLDKVAGARVLVVDDNNINIEVAIGVLSAFPLVFVKAANGQEAIEALISCAEDNKPIDCILMDCQMPIMDGYQCTRDIRQGKAGDQYISTPIIAMTASAMMGEREKCIDLGMNDYVTKPIVAEELQEKVFNWVVAGDFPKKRPTINNEIGSQFDGLNISADSNSVDMQINSLDSEVDGSACDELDTSNELEVSDDVWNVTLALARLMDDIPLFIDICQMYLDSTPVQIGELKAAIELGDWEKARQLSHGLKGLSSSIGAVELQAKLSDLEAATQEQNKQNLIKLYDEIDASYLRLIGLVEGYLEEQANLQAADD